MVTIFFLLSSIIFLCTSFSMLMFSNNLKQINKSIGILLDEKAYKPQNRIRFMTSLLQKHEQYTLNHPNELDISALIKTHFYEQRIGIFNAIKIEKTATKGKELLWFNTVTMTLIEVVYPSIDESKLNLALIIISAILGLWLILAEIYIDIEGNKDKLIIKLQNYLSNEHPSQMAMKKDNENTRKMADYILKLEKQLERVQQGSSDLNELQVSDSVELEEKDIIYLMHYLML